MQILAKSVLVRDFDFLIAASDRRIHRRHNFVKMEFDVRPLLVAEDDDGNFTLRKILLVAHVLIRGQEQFITGFFSLAEQVAVLEFVPAELPGVSHFVSGKTASNGIWRAVIEENSHPYAGALSKL